MNCANHSDREKIAFCQNCGKALCQECTRAVGAAVYCEPCLAAKLAGATSVPLAGAYGYSDPASGVSASGTATGGSYTYTDPASGVYASGFIPPQPPHGAPNPLLAGFLGFIPGVGAMYNEQYAKGGVHLIVFVILVSIANHTDVFGIFVAGWEFYMAFEAYRTAIARRDGLPLPNPFGLNDLGQKLGFDKSWHSTSATPVPPDPYAASYGTVPPAGTPVAGYPPPYTPPVAPPYAPPYSAGAVPPSWAAPPAWEQYAPPMPPPVPLDAQVPYPGNRFPAGAIWLIGLGAIFLLFNAGFMHGVSGRLFLPILLVGLAVFTFVRKMTCDGYGFSDDGTPNYRLRIFRALRGSIWLALVGLLFFLDEFNILSWGHSWPLFIITAGIMTVLQRVVYSSAAAVPPPYAPGYGSPYGYAQQPPPPVATPAPATTTEIVPTSTHDQEGS
jgi:TM2 domain-containing membrane protein YozV